MIIEYKELYTPCYAVHTIETRLFISEDYVRAVRVLGGKIRSLETKASDVKDLLAKCDRLRRLEDDVFELLSTIGEI